MQHIETVTVTGTSQATIEFLSIPDTFTDLYLKVSARSTATNTSPFLWRDGIIKPNGSATDGTMRELFGYASTADTGSRSSIFFRIPASNTTASTFGSAGIYIPNYASSANKSFSIDSATEDNSANAIRQIAAGLWSVTDVISSIVLAKDTGDYAIGTTASLYGITAGSDGIVAVS